MFKNNPIDEFYRYFFEILNQEYAGDYYKLRIELAKCWR